MNLEKIFNEDEQELFNILIMAGVKTYLSALYDRCLEEKDGKDLFLLGFEGLSDVLTKLGFNSQIIIKEINNHEM